MANRREKEEAVTFYFLGLQNDCALWLQQWNWKTLAPWKENYDKLRQHIKRQTHHSLKGQYSQSYVSFSSYVQMWGLDHKEGWAPKNRCFQIVVLEKTLVSPLDSKEVNQSILKEINSEYFNGRTDAEAEAPILWPPDVKSDTLEKTLMLGKIEAKWRRSSRRRDR